jgi:hypothetical protein
MKSHKFYAKVNELGYGKVLLDGEEINCKSFKVDVDAGDAPVIVYLALYADQVELDFETVEVMK